MTTKKTIKRLILSLGCASLALSPLASQVLEVRPDRTILTQLQQDFVSRNYVASGTTCPACVLYPLLTEHQPIVRR